VVAVTPHVQSEEEKLNNMLRARTIQMFESVFHPANTKTLSSEALIEFARLQISENCAQETLRIFQNFSKIILEAEMPYVANLVSAVRKSSRREAGSYNIDISGARKFLSGYMAVNYFPLAGRHGSLDKVSVPLNGKALDTRLEAMGAIIADAEVAIAAIMDICVVGHVKDASHTSR
jgi:hypothetical protein